MAKTTARRGTCAQDRSVQGFRGRDSYTRDSETLLRSPCCRSAGVSLLPPVLPNQRMLPDFHGVRLPQGLTSSRAPGGRAAASPGAPAAASGPRPSASARRPSWAAGPSAAGSAAPGGPRPGPARSRGPASSSPSRAGRRPAGRRGPPSASRQGPFRSAQVGAYDDRASC